MTDILDEAYVQECGLHETPLGPAVHLKIRRFDMRRMGWEDVWTVFADAYPGAWAVEVFPPEGQLVNDANIYHLFLKSPKG